MAIKEYLPTKEELLYLLDRQRVIQKELPEYDHTGLQHAKAAEWSYLRAIEVWEAMQRDK